MNVSLKWLGEEGLLIFKENFMRRKIPVGLLLVALVAQGVLPLSNDLLDKYTSTVAKASDKEGNIVPVDKYKPVFPKEYAPGGGA